MLPITYQIFEYSTTSGKTEIMLRCAKTSLSFEEISLIRSAIACFLQTSFDQLIWDQEKDPFSDRIYVYCDVQVLEPLLQTMFQVLFDIQKIQELQMLSIAHLEEEKPPLLSDFLAFLEQKGIEYCVF